MLYHDSLGNVPLTEASVGQVTSPLYIMLFVIIFTQRNLLPKIN